MMNTREVCRWLAAPDVSGNHKAARKIRHSQHGSWFVHGEGFMRWKEFPDQPLWLYGSRESLGDGGSQRSR